MSNTFKIFEASTMHVSLNAAQFFDSVPDYTTGAMKRPYMASEYGWLFTVPEKDDMDTTLEVGCAGFTACVIKAQEMNCAYLLLDCDALCVSDLPVYDW